MWSDQNLCWYCSWESGQCVSTNFRDDQGFFSLSSVFHFTFINAYWFYIVYRICNDIIFDNSQ